MTTKRILLTAALAAVATGAILATWKPKWSIARETVLLHTTTRTGDLSIDLVENGILEAESATHIAAPGSNSERKLIELVPEGTLVAKGDVLARFDTAILEESLTTLRDSGLQERRTDAELEARIRIADLEVAKQTAVENTRLAELTFRSMTYNARLERAAAEARLANAKNEIKVAENRLAQEENRRDVQLRQLDKLIDENKSKIESTLADIESFTVRSPGDGIVVYPLIKVGGIGRKIQTGDQLFKGQVFLVIPNLYRMTAVLDVPEEEIRRLKSGLPATVMPEAFPDHAFAGRVGSIAPLAHVRDNNPFIKAFATTVRIDVCDLERLRPGMNARVSIRLAEYKNANLLPVAFVESGAKGDFIYVETPSGIEARHVRIIDAGRDEVVLDAAVEERVFMPGTALRARLANPSKPFSEEKWSPQ
jgi:HlyD family secretion protein